VHKVDRRPRDAGGVRPEANKPACQGEYFGSVFGYRQIPLRSRATGLKPLLLY
jgi:hypothetical protein